MLNNNFLRHSYSSNSTPWFVTDYLRLYIFSTSEMAATNAFCTGESLKPITQLRRALGIATLTIRGREEHLRSGSPFVAQSPRSSRPARSSCLLNRLTVPDRGSSAKERFPPGAV